MASTFFQSFQKEFDAVMQSFQKECQSIRTGRATPTLVEDIIVDVYGVRGPVKQYASISVSDPKTMMIQPWDPQTLKDIEKGLAESHRGFSVSAISQTQLRVTLPMMTEENRKDLTKILHTKHEQARTQLRQVRDKARELIQRQERESEITQDDRYQLQKELDDITNQIQTALENHLEQKEKEILTV